MSMKQYPYLQLHLQDVEDDSGPLLDPAERLSLKQTHSDPVQYKAAPLTNFHLPKPILATAPPLMEKERKKLSVVLPLSNSVQTFFNVSKAIVGAGSFALPWCFKNMGLWSATVTLIAVALLSIYTILLLIKCKRYVVEQTLERYLTYVDITRYAFGKVGAGIVYFLMLVASLGVASAYLVFIGSTLASIAPASWNLTQTDFMLLILPFVVPLTWLRSFKYLSFTSILGVIALTAGMIATMLYGFMYTSLKPLSEYASFRPATYPLSFGTVAFLFCVHFLVLPIEESMKEPKKFSYSLTASIAFVTVTNTAFGFLGYMFFGEETCSIVIINLGDNIWVMIVKICLCVDLLFTYAIVFAPGREIVEKSLLTGKKYKWMGAIRNLIRTLMVALTFLFAQAKQFGIITNLVGGFSMSTLGLVLPPLLYIKFYRKQLSITSIVLHSGIILLGSVAVVITTGLSVASLFEHGDSGC